MGGAADVASGNGQGEWWWGPVEEDRDLWGLALPRDTPDQSARGSPNSSIDPEPRSPELPKAASNVFVADERALDGPEDLTGETTAQIGLYTYNLVRTAGPRRRDRGALTSAYPAPFATVVL
jgi:hypothetical protein